MARKVIGPTGSLRRRWIFLLCLVTMITGAVMFIPGALAVHDTGAFELDGNATSSTGPGGAAPDDWDRVCYQVTSNPNCGTSDTTHQQSLPGTPYGSTAVAWTGDCPIDSTGFGCTNPNATIFTGGGSKDPQDINNWAWKDGAGGLPDKDNLVHAFAARYSLQGTDKNGRCPNGTDIPSGTFDPSVNCDVIFFGSDRYDNSGDAQQGFWFLQNNITLGTNSIGGGEGFASSDPTSFHRNGDVLVVSDFSVGGTTATITVYQWETSCTKAVSNPQPGDCAAVNLLEVETSTDALCSASLTSNDGFCGITNPDGTPVPWSSDYTDKSGNSSTYLQGEFFEAGINLSTLGLAAECFSSVLSETRASTSPTATLKDFVLQSFAPCGARIKTNPSAGTTEATSVSPGEQVNDLATITGSGVSNPPYPSSPPNVTFYLCDPTTVIANGGDCHTGGDLVSDNALTDGATQGVSTATSDYVNTSASPLTPGTYCFRAEWTGDTNYPGTIKDGSTTECFTVRTITVSPVTTPSDSTGAALTSPLALGTTIYDTAVVTGTAAGGTPPGSVHFYLCGPSDLSPSTPGSEACATGYTYDLGTAPLSAVSDSSPPASSAISTGTPVNEAGVWCFRAVYVPTGSTYVAGDADASHSECVTVNPEDTTTTTTPQLSGSDIVAAIPFGSVVTDHAVVAAIDNADGTPTGTVDFFICTPTDLLSSLTGNCSSPLGETAGAGKTLTPLSGPPTPSTPSATADSNTVTADTVGTWCFRAVYTPGGTNGANYNPSQDPPVDSTSTTECFTVLPITVSPVTTPSDSTGTGFTSSLALGTTIYDTAVVTGTAAGGTPPGSVQFWLCDPSQLNPSTAGSEACASGGTPLGSSDLVDSGSSPAGPTSTAISAGTPANEAGVWCFRAVYVPTGSTYVAGDADASHSECVTVNPEDTTTTTTPLLSDGTSIVGALPVGTVVKDHAVVAAIDNADGTPTGTVDFFICDPTVVEASPNGNCSYPLGDTAGAGKTLTELTGQPTPSATADSNAVTADAVGTWCFRAVYTPGPPNGANYNPSQDPLADSTSTTECFLVQDSTSMSSSQTWVPNDEATVTSKGGTALTGTLSIDMYIGVCNADKSDVASSPTPTLVHSYSTDLTDASSPQTFPTSNATAYSVDTSIAFVVTFTPDSGTNVTGSQHCEESSVSISNNNAP